MRPRASGALLALALTACATPKTDVAIGPVPAPPTAIPVIAAQPPPDRGFAALVGWESEDHLAALNAYRAGCPAARDAATAAICRKAQALGPGDGTAARAFLEANFRPEPVGETGLLTAYFAPVYEARGSRRGPFTAPVRARPADLVITDLSDIDPTAAPGRKLVGRVRDGQVEAYPDRAAIETREMGKVLAWMRPEELFFLQIQGSGVLTFPDGSRKRAAFAAHNGLPFAGIARPMREKGLLKDADTSGDAIRGWLAEHRGREADAIMRLNPRYVFFSLTEDDGRDPAGAAGISLPAGRAYFNHFPVDDAFIIFRYSRNLADGLGPTWNSEGRVEGYTSFLWMALPAGLSKLGFDLIESARVLAWGSLAATFFVVYRIWKLWADEHEGTGLDSPVVLAVALLAVAMTDGIAFWGFSGMETPLLTLLLTGGAYLYLLERRRGGPPWSAVAFVAAAMTRPEALIAAGVTGAFTVVDALHEPDRRRALIHASSWVGLFAPLYGSYFLWRYAYYDYLLPNTYYAKADPTRAVVARGFDYVRNGALQYQLLPMFGGAAALLTMPRLRQDAAYL
ncbi:MAG: MltA domain-containing protein, partial [Phenylobacterium sp.]|nr:MltA domain-containing protein [Phenylobacterium sp.]